jgi:hypothetical protein
MSELGHSRRFWHARNMSGYGIISEVPIYSPWTGNDLHQHLRSAGLDTAIITGGETEYACWPQCWAQSTGAFA